MLVMCHSHLLLGKSSPWIHRQNPITDNNVLISVPREQRVGLERDSDAARLKRRPDTACTTDPVFFLLHSFLLKSCSLRPFHSPPPPLDTHTYPSWHLHHPESFTLLQLIFKCKFYDGKIEEAWDNRLHLHSCTAIVFCIAEKHLFNKITFWQSARRHTAALYSLNTHPRLIWNIKGLVRMAHCVCV